MTDQPATPGNYCKIPGCTEPFAYDHRCERHTDDDPCACGSTLVICSCGDERCLRCDPHGCRPFKPVTPTHAIRAHDAERQLTGYPGPSVYPPADSIQVRPWQREDIEHHNAERGTVFVFRWVPDYAPFGGRREQHPTFNEWLDDMRAAANGLEGPKPATRVEYDTTLGGVDGSRPMTDAERLAYADTLRAEITARTKQLEAISDLSQESPGYGEGQD